jgi:hypothetical protein
MAPKAKAARPRVQITGKAGTPQISWSDGSVDVSKKLSGATLTETFTRKRVRGEAAQGAQLIPVQDVLEVLQSDAATTAADSFAEAERRMASRIVKDRKRKLLELRRMSARDKNKERMQKRTRRDTAIGKRAMEAKKARESREERPARPAGPAGPARPARTVAERLNDELGL